MNKWQGAASALAIVLSTVALPGAKAPAVDPQGVLHVISRITFGPTPGDFERVRQMGVDRFIDDQLHPERRGDESALTGRLQGLDTLSASSREIAQRFAIPALLARRDRQQGPADSGADRPRPQRAMTQPAQRQANLPLVELSEQKLLRATYGEHQLEEVLTDFWFNHFNVDARKGPVRFMLTDYERDVIRPHVLGRFRDLLGATAKSPAMLFYLDNWMSADPKGARLDRARPIAGRLPRPSTTRQPPQVGGGRPQPPRQRAMGLNENYGRELLELHTLGVDGGYTQKDVTEVARAFTGWTIDTPRLGGGFRFAPAMHDAGEKTVLGHRIKAGGGQRDGEEVLDLLATHPSTARFISTKLARRFVSDMPPAPLVARMADTFRRTGGDLRSVMTVLLSSPEFLAADVRRSKVKDPFEFIVSSLRATGADVRDARPLVRAVQQLGMPLYQCQPPTGYRDSAETWVNTGALVNRMNVALAMASGRIPGVTLDLPADAATVIAGEIAPSTRDTIAKANGAPQALALALGSPEFQRH